MVWIILLIVMVVIVDSVVVWFIFSSRRKQSQAPAENELDALRADRGQGVIYSDQLVKLTSDAIKFRCYYFPAGSKTVSFSDVTNIEAKAPTIWNGKWRIHGSNLMTWFPCDWKRPVRDKIFFMRLRNKMCAIGFTVEDSAGVLQIFRDKGLLTI